MAPGVLKPKNWEWAEVSRGAMAICVIAQDRVVVLALVADLVQAPAMELAGELAMDMEYKGAVISKWGL